MKLLLRIIFAALSIFFLLYLLLPEPAFPAPPSDAKQSFEPADSETPLRRAYFTDFTREEVMNNYKNQFGWGYRLNYPPEEAKTLIRDQTRSTFLEEVVHPFRESLFVNGFEPKDPKDLVIIEGKLWRQKITVRYVPSNRYLRVALALVTIIAIWVLAREWKETIVKWILR